MTWCEWGGRRIEQPVQETLDRDGGHPWPITCACGAEVTPVLHTGRGRDWFWPAHEVGVRGVLMWDKPEKIMSIEQWKSISADSAPPGVYVPNMSEADKKRWKAKLVGKRTDHPQVEIRKTARGAQILVIVNLGAGYNYGTHKIEPNSWGGTTKGVNLHISMNGAAQLTFQDWEDMKAAVTEAKTVLEALDAQRS